MKSKPAPPKVNSVPASPWVSTSAPTMPAHMQIVLREAISSSPMQTTEIQAIAPQETNMTSSPLNSYTADGNGVTACRRCLAMP